MPAAAASQSSFGDWLSKISSFLLGTGSTSTAITGYATETVLCSDSDGGANYNVKGSVTGKWPGADNVETETDGCCVDCYASPPTLVSSSDTLGETYCNSENKIALDIHKCDGGCKEGICLSAPVEKEPVEKVVCSDSDGGRDYYVYGVSYDGINNYNEYCSGDVLKETYCSGAQIVTEEYKCPYGCKEGVCLKEQTPAPAPTPVTVKEQVKCVFANSDFQQKCYSDDGRFSCSGTGTCVADVSGDKGTKLTWKSSCGGYAYTVSDEVNEQAEFKCETTPTPTPTPTPAPSCTDSDTGFNLGVKGITADADGPSSDECIYTEGMAKPQLKEYWCDSATSKKTRGGQVYNCEAYGYSTCQDGACVKEQTLKQPVEQPVMQVCSDSDGGINYNQKGTVTYNKNFEGKYQYSLTDSCSGSTLNEYYCDSNGNAQTSYYTCQYGCKDGACVRELREVPREVPKEVPTSVCPATIDFSFDKTSYKAGEPYTVKVATYDSSGNLVGADLDVTTERDGKAQDSTISTKPSGTRTDSGTISSSLVGDYVFILKSKPQCQNIVTAVQKFVISGEITIGECTDTDGGMNYYKQGYMNVSYEGPGGSGYWDYCDGANELVEHYCGSNGEKQRTTYYCPDGCKDGACLSETATTANCPAKIEFAFDESTYVAGETFKSKLATYDEKGNLIGADLAATFAKNGKVDQASVTTKPAGVLWQSGYFGESGTYTYTYKSMPSCQNIVTVAQRIAVVEGTEGTCTDSDNTYAVTHGERSTYNPPGDDRFVKGTVSYAGKTFEDYCVNQVHYTDSLGNKVIRYDNVGQGEIVIEQACIDGKKYYEATPYPCPNGCRDGACAKPEPSVKPPEVPKKTEVPEGKYVYGVQIKKGWNLISLIPFFLTAPTKVIVQGEGAPSGQSEQEESGPVSITCSWAKNEQYSRENVFGYDSINKRYVRLSELGSMTAPDLNKGSYLVNTPVNGFWLRSTEDCSITMDFGTSAGTFKMLDEISKNGYKLAKGWNFFIVLPEMEGKTLDDIKGSCEIKRAYAYDALARKWTNLEGVEFSRNAVSYGFVTKVADDCVLGESSVIGLPPPLPDEESGVAIQRTTAAPTVQATVKTAVPESVMAVREKVVG